MKKYQQILSHLVIALFFIVPLFATAAPIVVDCGTSGNPCDFNDFMDLIDNVLNAMIYISLMVAVAIIIKIGWKMITSGDSPGVRTEAKNKLQSVFIGLAWVIGAWFVVNLVLSILLKDEYILVK